ncbi:MAG TPA: MASE1 domain-containing protein, partial [Gemmatimonadales bacterium]|nr:MASE1 domain-containing protein [Gemmatimonadales bacterium]
MIQSRLLRRLGLLAALAVGYFVAGKLGLEAAYVHPSATVVWPPSGLTLAAFLLFGYEVWPAILLGAFLVNITTAGSIATSAAIAAGNTLEGLVGAYLINRFASGHRVCERARDVFKLAGLAALLSTTISATAGVVALSLGGFARWTDFGS